MKKLTRAIFVGLTLTTMASLFAQQADKDVNTQKADKPAVKDKEKDADKDAESSGSFWMTQKMKYSTEILAGLAEGDFDKIGKNGALMKGLNRMERFVRRHPEGYRDELKQFNMANNAILRAAEDENLEAATLAFNRLTISCVSCHQRLRSQADAADASR